MQALSLAKECYSMKLDLLTNVGVIKQAMKFVTDKKRGDNAAVIKRESSITTTSTTATTKEPQPQPETVNKVF